MLKAKKFTVHANMSRDH